MAKKERTGAHDPEVAAAVFCETVLVERDGTHSFVRIIDAVRMLAPPGVDLKEAQALTHPLALGIVLRSRNAEGSRRITVRHRPPAGGAPLGGLPTDAEVVVLPGRSTLATVRLTGGAVVAGRHEFEVRVGGRSLATVPLDIHFSHGEDE